MNFYFTILFFFINEEICFSYTILIILIISNTEIKFFLSIISNLPKSYQRKYVIYFLQRKTNY